MHSNVVLAAAAAMLIAAAADSAAHGNAAPHDEPAAGASSAAPAPADPPAPAQAPAGAAPGAASMPVPTVARPISKAERERARSYFTDLPVVDQNGESRRFYSDVLDDRIVLINFIYTNCTDACPLTTQQLKQVQAALGDKFGTSVYFVSISVDPERDTPAALRAFAKKQGAEHPAWSFLTGDKANVDLIVRKLGQAAPSPEAHSTLMIAGNTRTGHWAKVTPTATAMQIVFKLEALAGEL